MEASSEQMTNNFLHDTRGAALAELALVLPLLLLLLLGMLDFGKAFNQWMSGTHLANEGARLAAVNYCPAPSSDGSGNLTCDWSSIGCSASDANVCLAQYIDNQATGELKNGRPSVSAYSPTQNAARVCISYPNGAATQIGDPVTVRVQFNYKWLNYVSKRLSFGSTPISGSATMRLESKWWFGTTPGTTATCYPDAPAGT
jgi:Flp pilus assembly protein TadG